MKAKNKQTGEIVEVKVYNNMYAIRCDEFAMYSKTLFDTLYEIVDKDHEDYLKHEQKLIWLRNSDRHVENPNHAYVGGEVEDKETWREQLHNTYRRTINGCYWVELGSAENIFQQELERIKTNFMKEFTDPDTNLINICKYDHEELINFFNREIK